VCLLICVWSGSVIHTFLLVSDIFLPPLFGVSHGDLLISRQSRESRRSEKPLLDFYDFSLLRSHESEFHMQIKKKAEERRSRNTCQSSRGALVCVRSRFASSPIIDDSVFNFQLDAFRLQSSILLYLVQRCMANLRKIISDFLCSRANEP
jgi:hypothetical protein